MAFVPLDSYRTVRVLSGTDVIDVQYVTAASSPSGFGFAYAVPYDAWLSAPGSGNALLDVIATQLEEIGSNGQMVASSPIQDLDKNGLMQDWVSAVVEYQRTGLPALQGTTNIPVQAFFSQETGIGGFTVPGVASPNSYIVAEYDRLAALAGG